IIRTIPVRYVWSDRVHGELHRPFLATPEATANFEKETYVFATNQPNRIGVKVKTFQNRFSTKLQLDLPVGWTCTPKEHLISLPNALEETTLFFEVTPPLAESMGIIKPILTAVDQPIRSFEELNYEHIAPQNWFPPAQAKVVRVQTQIVAGKVGYIQGAGDEVADGLEQMGFEVIPLNERQLSQINLNELKAIVVGIRAYNTNPWLLNYHQQLNEFVKQGGNLIVQYNTATADLLTNEIGPYAFRISRDRVTEEDATPRLISSNHAIWNIPNTISPQDFEGWVQERGLYFADQWAPELMPMISWSDSGETPKSGGLLFGNYGKGAFMYTGISFFRQLPAGVPGAYRILANMVSYESKR
ncbi:MAG: LmbE family protein, partial [Schleiferiaceae bacterium]|nr:LmbE family protein [Schleiferiaceae bacterium]